MGLKDQTSNIPEDAIEIVTDDNGQTDLFGFEAEYEPNDYTTISGKEYRDMTGATAYNIQDFELSNVITGYPELTIFPNNDKDENGDYKRNYQSIRFRIIDGDEEYVDLYANIPHRDDKGFIHNLNHYQKFYRSGFDLVFSFMRWVNEENVYDDNGETINKIKMVNIDNICKKIDAMEYVKVKIIKGAEEAYPSFIILDLKAEI